MATRASPAPGALDSLEDVYIGSPTATLELQFKGRKWKVHRYVVVQSKYLLHTFRKFPLTSSIDLSSLRIPSEQSLDLVLQYMYFNVDCGEVSIPPELMVDVACALEALQPNADILYGFIHMQLHGAISDPSVSVQKVVAILASTAGRGPLFYEAARRARARIIESLLVASETFDLSALPEREVLDLCTEALSYGEPGIRQGMWSFLRSYLDVRRVSDALHAAYARADRDGGLPQGLTHPLPAAEDPDDDAAGAAGAVRATAVSAPTAAVSAVAVAAPLTVGCLPGLLPGLEESLLWRVLSMPHTADVALHRPWLLIIALGYGFESMAHRLMSTIGADLPGACARTLSDLLLLPLPILSKLVAVYRAQRMDRQTTEDSLVPLFLGMASNAGSDTRAAQHVWRLVDMSRLSVASQSVLLGRPELESWQRAQGLQASLAAVHRMEQKMKEMDANIGDDGKFDARLQWSESALSQISTALSAVQQQMQAQVQLVQLQQQFQQQQQVLQLQQQRMQVLQDQVENMKLIAKEQPKGRRR